MQTDLVLEHRDAQRRIVIDTKFTKILHSGWHWDATLKSPYIYQIYAYLRSQEGQGDPLADQAEGWLLHPSIGRSIDEFVEVQGHSLRFVTVDLAVPQVKQFRTQLLGLLGFEPPVT